MNFQIRIPGRGDDPVNRSGWGPHSAMVHIKDGEKVDGQVEFCLPGDGGIDIPGFLTALRANGLEDMPVFAEVSVQQSGQADYSPRRAAEFCYDALDKARISIS